MRKTTLLLLALLAGQTIKAQVTSPDTTRPGSVQPSGIRPDSAQPGTAQPGTDPTPSFQPTIDAPVGQPAPPPTPMPMGAEPEAKPIPGIETTADSIPKPLKNAVYAMVGVHYARNMSAPDVSSYWSTGLLDNIPLNGFQADVQLPIGGAGLFVAAGSSYTQFGFKKDSYRKAGAQAGDVQGASDASVAMELIGLQLGLGYRLNLANRVHPYIYAGGRMLAPVRNAQASYEIRRTQTPQDAPAFTDQQIRTLTWQQQASLGLVGGAGIIIDIVEFVGVFGEVNYGMALTGRGNLIENTETHRVGNYAVQNVAQTSRGIDQFSMLQMKLGIAVRLSE